MNFEWDEAKADANLEKHRIDFPDAIMIFAKPHFTYDRIGMVRSGSSALEASKDLPSPWSGPRASSAFAG